MREKSPIGQSEQPILTPYCLCSLSREVNKLKSRMFQRNVHIVSELLRGDFHKQSCSKKLKRMRYDAAFKLEVINFAKGMNNSSAAREFDVVREWQRPKSCSVKCPRQSAQIVGKLADDPNQQRSSGFIVTRPTIQLQALKWSEKYCELSVDFKATRGCVLGLCRDISLYFEEFDGF